MGEEFVALSIGGLSEKLFGRKTDAPPQEHDFPEWQNVRYHYDIWSNPDENGVRVLDRVLRKLVEAEREKNGRKAQTTMVMVDSKSIQNADNAEEKGYNAGKSIWDKTTYWREHFGAAPRNYGDDRQCNRSNRRNG